MSSIAISSLRGTLAGLSLTSLVLFLRSDLQSGTELDLSSYCLISLTAAASEALISGNSEDVLSELLASGIGLTCILTFLAVCGSDDEENHHQESLTMN